MIQKSVCEYVDGDRGYYTVSIFFLGIPIYEYILCSTNKNMVEDLKPYKKITKVKGFKK